MSYYLIIIVSEIKMRKLFAYVCVMCMHVYMCGVHMSLVICVHFYACVCACVFYVCALVEAQGEW